MDDRTFVDILRDRAQHSGDKIAYRFLVSGDKQESTLTYGQLHQRALAIAAVLRDEAKPGDRVLLLYPPGLEFICAFFGCLYAGVIAVPAYPLGKSRLVQNVKRLELMSQNCTPAVVLCDDRIQAVFEERITADIQKSVLQDMNGQPMQQYNSLALLQAKVISTANVMDVVSESMIVSSLSKDLAFLQYTSGSTGHPKGVMVSHGNLSVNAEVTKERYHHTAECIVASWLPQYHDMGLIGSILQPLYCGMLSVMFAPASFLTRPLNWLKIIAKHGATSSGCPNFSYELCVTRFSEEEMQGVDLSSWKVAYCGAEPIRKETIELFINKFEPYGFNPNVFFPVYGMAEHTLLITAGTLGQPYKSIRIDKETLSKNEVVEDCRTDQAKTFVGCGCSLKAHQVVIVGAENKQILNDNQVGEIWCRGSSVAQGYWGNEEATQEIFQAYTQDGRGPFLRTGDLGFLKDGELCIVGRLKDTIIIRGRNYAPQDIECSVESSHIGIRQGCVAAFSYAKEGVEKLAVVCEIKRTYIKKDHNEIIQSVIEKITRENELSVSLIVLLKPGQIFKTTSGKIQRHKTKQVFLNGELNTLKTWKTSADVLTILPPDMPDSVEAIEQHLKNWLAGRLNIVESNIDSSIAFMYLGLDSIALVEMSRMLSCWLKCEFSVEVFFNHASIASLSSYLAHLIGLVDIPDKAGELKLNNGDQSDISYPQFTSVEKLKSRQKLLRIVSKMLIKLVTKVKVIGIEKVNLDQNYIILSNHSCKLDGMLNISLLPNTVAVVSDSHFYSNWLGRMFSWFNCIPTMKNLPDPRTIQSIHFASASGLNVYLAPEGQMTWGGEFQELKKGLGALLKFINKPVLLVRYHNGFRHSPRWAKRYRKTKVLCEILPPVKIDKAMPTNQIEELIRDKLSFDISREQKFQARSKHFAEGLENVLWICLKCNSVDSLYSKNNILACGKCNSSWEIDQDSNLRDNAGGGVSLSAAIKRVASIAQRQIEFGELLNLRSNHQVKVYCFSRDKLRLKAKGFIYIDRNSITIENKYPIKLELSCLYNVNLDMAKRLSMRYRNIYYEFSFASNESACKWFHLIDYFSNFKCFAMTHENAKFDYV